MSTYAIVVAKRFGLAKQRLQEALSADVRARLAAAMLDDLLTALDEVRSLDGLLVVTPEPRAGTMLADRRAERLHDPYETGPSAAHAIGVERAVACGATRTLTLAADCPTLSRADLDSLLAVDVPVVVATDRHGTGTNALLLCPPHRIDAAFGPGSCVRHVQSARRAGVACCVLSLPTLALDLDTADDLAAVRAAARTGPRTRAVLDGAPVPPTRTARKNG